MHGPLDEPTVYLCIQEISLILPVILSSYFQNFAPSLYVIVRGPFKHNDLIDTLALETHRLCGGVLNRWPISTCKWLTRLSSLASNDGS